MDPFVRERERERVLRMAAADFQWLSLREAVLHRPDAYLGPNDVNAERVPLLQPDGVLADVDVVVSPIFAKLFDEVLVNALDAATRDHAVRSIHVIWDAASGAITVRNDGAGIAVELFGDTGRYLPSVVFSELNAGSNFDDSKSRLVGGRNGVGVSCCNIWSTDFEVSVCDGRKLFRQRWTANAGETAGPAAQGATCRSATSPTTGGSAARSTPRLRCWRLC